MDIPQDIIDNVIIAAVGNDTRLLKQCTLVSSSFLIPSRKQLFSRITLRSDQTCHGIHQFLVQNPVIQYLVRSITLTGNDDIDSRHGFSVWMNGTSLLAILRLPSCCLECFSIITNRDTWTPYTSWNWNAFSCELKDALSNIIHSSTLKTLTISGITNVPITFLLPIVHLTTLGLHSILPNNFHDGNLSSLASHSVIQVDRCVWHFKRAVRGYLHLLISW
jgi:hypothetical protein